MDKRDTIRRIATATSDGTFEAKAHYRPGTADSAADPQRFFQRYPRLYTLIRDILSPTATFHHWRREVPPPATHVVVNLGCGCTDLDPAIINIDMVKFPHVDLVADFMRHIPVESGTVDAAIAIAVLEHLEDPRVFVDEVRRILKPGGSFFVATPFLYPFHAAPGDYGRWTLPGLRLLLGDAFEVVRSGNRGGAMGVIILAMAHALAQLLCFGSERLYAVLNFAFLGLFTPLRVFDLLLGYLPFAQNLSPNVWMTVKKKAQSAASALA